MAPGFGASQGSGYVEFSDNGSNWGGSGEPTLQIDSWSDTAVTFTVPSTVSPGSPASATVVTGTGRHVGQPGSGDHSDRQSERLLRQHRHLAGLTTRPAPTTTASATATRPTR